MTSDLVTTIHERILDLGDAASLESIVAEMAPLGGRAAHVELVRQVRARLAGLGSVDHLVRDPSVAEVMINGPGEVWVERAGRIEPAGVWLDADELTVLVERIVAPSGRVVDPRRPWVDALLADGSRANVVAAPVAVDGPYVTIRRFALDRPDLRAFGPDSMAARLSQHVADGASILVSGGTGSGKTTLLNGLAGAIDPALRVVTVEDVAELRLSHPHVVRLEGRPPGAEGVGEVALRDLVRAALRMRPDRLVVGEVRGPEAFDLLQAFNTGHDGGLATIHANSPQDALRRLVSLVAAAGTGLPHGVIAEQLAAAVDVVVQVARTGGVARRVVMIADVAPDGAVVPTWAAP